jgi:hypothetical protein
VKLTYRYQVKKFPVLYVTKMFITIFKYSTFELSLEPHGPSLHTVTYFIPILILFSYAGLSYGKNLLHSDFLTRIVEGIRISSMYTCAVNFALKREQKLIGLINVRCYFRVRTYFFYFAKQA